MQPLDKTRDDIRDVLAKHEVALGYVFGSYAQGRESALSDVDVAVIFNRNVPTDEYFKRELKLAGAVGDILKIDRVDIINLATVSDPLLKHRAVFLGVPVLVGNQKLKFQLERHIMQEYEDTEHLRKNTFRLMSQRLQQGTFGTVGVI